MALNLHKIINREEIYFYTNVSNISKNFKGGTFMNRYSFTVLLVSVFIYLSFSPVNLNAQVRNAAVGRSATEGKASNTTGEVYATTIKNYTSTQPPVTGGYVQQQPSYSTIAPASATGSAYATVGRGYNNSTRPPVTGGYIQQQPSYPTAAPVNATGSVYATTIKDYTSAQSSVAGSIYAPRKDAAGATTNTNPTIMYRNAPEDTSENKAGQASLFTYAGTYATTIRDYTLAKSLVPGGSAQQQPSYPTAVPANTPGSTYATTIRDYTSAQSLVPGSIYTPRNDVAGAATSIRPTIMYRKAPEAPSENKTGQASLSTYAGTYATTIRDYTSARSSVADGIYAIRNDDAGVTTSTSPTIMYRKAPEAPYPEISQVGSSQQSYAYSSPIRQDNTLEAWKTETGGLVFIADNYIDKQGSLTVETDPDGSITYIYDPSYTLSDSQQGGLGNPLFNIPQSSFDTVALLNAVTLPTDPFAQILINVYSGLSYYGGVSGSPYAAPYNTIGGSSPILYGGGNSSSIYGNYGGYNPSTYGYNVYGSPSTYGYNSYGASPAYGYNGYGFPSTYGYNSYGASPAYGYNGYGSPSTYGYNSYGASPAYGYGSYAPPAYSCGNGYSTTAANSQLNSEILKALNELTASWNQSMDSWSQKEALLVGALGIVLPHDVYAGFLSDYLNFKGSGSSTDSIDTIIKKLSANLMDYPNSDRTLNSVSLSGESGEELNLTYNNNDLIESVSLEGKELANFVYDDKTNEIIYMENPDGSRCYFIPIRFEGNSIGKLIVITPEDVTDDEINKIKAGCASNINLTAGPSAISNTNVFTKEFIYKAIDAYNKMLWEKHDDGTIVHYFYPASGGALVVTIPPEPPGKSLNITKVAYAIASSTFNLSNGIDTISETDTFPDGLRYLAKNNDGDDIWLKHENNLVFYSFKPKTGGTLMVIIPPKTTEVLSVSNVKSELEESTFNLDNGLSAISDTTIFPTDMEYSAMDSQGKMLWKKYADGTIVHHLYPESGGNLVITIPPDKSLNLSKVATVIASPTFNLSNGIDAISEIDTFPADLGYGYEAFDLLKRSLWKKRQDGSTEICEYDADEYLIKRTNVSATSATMVEYFFRPSSGGSLIMVTNDNLEAEQIKNIESILNTSGFKIASEAGRNTIVGKNAEITFPSDVDIAYYAFADDLGIVPVWKKVKGILSIYGNTGTAD
ncbi:MAG: hypothetical protein V1872_14360 [bacterium]